MTTQHDPSLTVFSWTPPSLGLIQIPGDELPDGVNITATRNVPENWKTRAAGRRSVRIKNTNRSGLIVLTLPKEHPMNNTFSNIILLDVLTENQVGIITVKEEGGSKVTGSAAFLATEPDYEHNGSDASDNVWTFYCETLVKYHGGFANA